MTASDNTVSAQAVFSDFELRRMASQAGMIPISCNKTSFDTEQSAYTPELRRFAALVAAKEREECLEVAEMEPGLSAHRIAQRIRARGTKEGV